MKTSQNVLKRNEDCVAHVKATSHVGGGIGRTYADFCPSKGFCFASGSKHPEFSRPLVDFIFKRGRIILI
jgi:hypothetical protein